MKTGQILIFNSDFDHRSNIWAASWQNQQCGCAPSEDSDQPGHLPSLIRVFAVRMKKAWVLSYPLSAQRRLWSDWVDAQADLSLRWAHTHFVGFVTRRLIYWMTVTTLLKCIINWPAIHIVLILTRVQNHQDFLLATISINSTTVLVGRPEMIKIWYLFFSKKIWS